MFCNACGAECPDASTFCSKCGQAFIPSSPTSFPVATRPRFDVNNLTRPQIALIVLLIVGFLVVCGILTDTSKPGSEQQASTSGSGTYLDQLWNTQTDKATHDCVATRGVGQCETGEELNPFRNRLVLFVLDDKEVWLSPDDNGFRTLQPAGADHQRHRAEVLAQLGDYSGTAIYLVQGRVNPTQYLSSLYPDLTASKLFYDNKLNSFAWSAVDNSRWCGAGCWMVWCFMKTDKNRNFGPADGYWQVNVNTKSVSVVDKTATQKFFTTTNPIVDTKSQQNDLEKLRIQTDEYCTNSLIQYGPEVGKGMCDAAIDSMVSESSGKPSAYDLCMYGSDAACDIANEHMSPADPRWKSLQARRHRTY